MSTVWVQREQIPEQVKKMVKKTDVVLDIGPGLKPQQYFLPNVHICVEPYKPYIDQLNKRLPDKRYSRMVFINSTWADFIKILPDKSVDSVFALDVVEHMEKEEGLAFLKEAERIARHQIMIFTPLGFYPQAYEEETDVDRYGMKGTYWQTHRSGWSPEDFGSLWDVLACKAYHKVDKDNNQLNEPFGAIWAFRNFEVSKREVSEISELRKLWWKYIPHSYRAILRGILGKGG